MTAFGEDQGWEAEDEACAVHVSGLAPVVDEATLVEAFSTAGSVVSAALVRDPATKQRRGSSYGCFLPLITAHSIGPTAPALPWSASSRPTMQDSR